MFFLETLGNQDRVSALATLKLVSAFHLGKIFHPGKFFDNIILVIIIIIILVIMIIIILVRAMTEEATAVDQNYSSIVVVLRELKTCLMG